MKPIRPLSSYRPQHDDSCLARYCGKCQHAMEHHAVDGAGQQRGCKVHLRHDGNYVAFCACIGEPMACSCGLDHARAVSQEPSYVCPKCGGTKPTCCSCPPDGMEAESAAIRRAMKDGDTQTLANYVNRGNAERAKAAVSRIKAVSQEPRQEQIEQATEAHNEAIRQLAAAIGNDYDPSEREQDAAWVACKRTLDALISALRAAPQEQEIAGYKKAIDDLAAMKPTVTDAIFFATQRANDDLIDQNEELKAQVEALTRQLAEAQTTTGED